VFTRKLESKKNGKEVGKETPVNGLCLYYEIHGTGQPLVLLHGGISASEVFAPLLPALNAHRQVIAVHLQGHGRTEDIDRPLRVESLAGDVMALLKQLGLPGADILGYSLGGEVALQLAIHHPQLVHKLVLVSTPFKRQGYYPEVLADFDHMGPEAGRFMDQSPLSRLYPGKDWGALFGKMGDLVRQEFDWSKGVAGIRCPVMLVYADADAIRPEHILEFFTRLGGGQRDARMDCSGHPLGQLAILPGMSHYDILTYPGLSDMLASFLDAPMPNSVGTV
jgi:pimeloyl-ACP methyl ester carboxylesterase